MDGKYIPHSPKVSFAGWSFDFGPLDEPIGKAVEETISEAFEDDPPHVSLPFFWSTSDGIGGPPPSDPLTVHIFLGVFGDGTNMGPGWSVSIGDIIKEDFSDEMIGHDQSAIDRLEKLRDSLNEIVKWLDDRISAAQSAAKGT